MYKTTTIAFAAASALIISGCATSAWQQPPNHPADPSGEPGITTAITSLDRYSARAKSVPAPDDAEPMEEMDHSMHGDHEEAQP